MRLFSPLELRMGGLQETEGGAAPSAVVSPELRVGTKVAGYRLDALIGRGGMGVVYRGQHLHLRRTAALKLLVPELAHDDLFRQRFLRESRLAAAIQHPNIVAVYDAGEAEGLLYIAMQYIEGTDLAAVLRRDGPLEPERALTILGQVAEALDAAHALDMIHRDVKPGNVLIDSRCCYLTDFGLTRKNGSGLALTNAGEFVGTVDYMPPEQIQGQRVDSRTDVYALGCMLYHALVGRVPYERDSEVSVIYAHMHDDPPSASHRKPGLPKGLDDVIEQALAKRGEDRHTSCTELISAAWAALGHPSRPAALTPISVAHARTIVVADGEASIRALARVSLDERRFRVFEASDGDAAIDLARRVRPDVVLIDWNLPGRSSKELCEALRAGAETAETKIVVLAARGDAVDEGVARAAGADGAIKKPFSSMQLLIKLSELLGADAVR